MLRAATKRISTFCFFLGLSASALGPHALGQAQPDVFKQAEASYDQRKFDAARVQFETILKGKLAPDVRRRGQHLLALTYFALGDTRKAVDQWEVLYEEDTKDALAIKVAYNLGLAYSRLAQPKEAYEALSKPSESLIEAQPAPVKRAYSELLGQTATALDKNENAVLAFSSGLQSTTDLKARKALLDQLDSAAKKLNSAEKLQNLANQVKDAEAKKRILEAKNAQAKKPEPQPIRLYHDFSVTPLLGVSRMDYTQTALDLLQLSAIKVGLGFAYRFSPSWKVYTSTNIYTVALETKGNDTSTRLVNAQLGLEYGYLSTPHWQSQVRLAYTYASLLTPRNKYGFRDLAGPQLSVVVFKNLGVVDGIRLDVGAAVLNNDRSVLTLESHKIFVGMGYRWGYSDTMPPLEIELRYTDHSLNFSTASARGKTYDLIFTSEFDFDL